MKRSAPATTGAPSVVLIVCAVGLAARILAGGVIVPHIERVTRLAPDPDQYAVLAASLLDRHELGFSPPGVSPTTVRGPAFPGWLVLGMVAAGRAGPWVAIWAAVPGVLAAAAIAAMLARSHGRRAALVGGLFAAAHPLACFASARVFSDEFYGVTVFLALAAVSFAALAERSRAVAAWAVAAGALLAAAALTRATAVGVVLLLAVVGAASGGRARRVAAAVVLTAAIPIGAWAVRSSALAGAPTLIESLVGYNFWLGESNHRFGFAGGFGESRKRAHELIAQETDTRETIAPTFWYATLTPTEARRFDRTLLRAAGASIAKRPFDYALRCVAGAIWYWTRAETAARTVQFALVALPLLALSAVGVRRLLQMPSPEALSAPIVVSVIVLHVALYAAICPMARYSVQLYPLMSYLAGIGAAAVFGWKYGPVGSNL